ncbi:MAG: ferredoxin-type protein NapF [Gammaproteobacteria bacterium]|nr:ferredoxin-type protein NapF [Gammaproteobacteria bacterium]
MDMQRRNLFRGKLFTQSEDIRLPWLKSFSLFYEKCTQCGDCIKACPEKVLLKGGGGYPAIDFKAGECTFCGDCAQSCTENLFEKPEQSKPWSFVAMVGESCLAYQQVSCRSCQDSCEHAAITFKLEQGKTPVPRLISHLCTGCGACVSPCPTSAIDVVSENKQQLLEGSLNVS